MHIAAILEQAFLSQAVGDAVGYPLEFADADYEAFRAVYNGKLPLVISDDTQMALFGLHGITQARFSYGEENSFGYAVSCVLRAYLDWHTTQTYPHKKPPSREHHPLFVPELLQPRVPGNTCISSLTAIKAGQAITYESKGNGALMRTLPFLFAPSIVIGMTNKEAVDFAVACGHLTHTHKESELAVRAYMHLAQSLLYDVLSGRRPNIGAAACKTLKEYSLFSARDTDTFTALPALCKAFSALIAYEGDFEKVLKACVYGDGDSDTVAAIAMGLHGIVYPAPEGMVRRVVEADIIRQIARSVWENPRVRKPVQEIRPGSAESAERN